MGLAAAVYGLFCYAVFLASFLYSMGFIGDLVVPKTIDSLPSAGLPEALAFDVVLLGLFAVQHSVMARQGFKAVWTRIVPRAIGTRSTYVLISSLLLGLICWKWQAIPMVVWDASSPVFRSLLLAMFAIGWLMVLLSTFMINHFDLFGLRQVYLRLRGLEYTPVSFALEPAIGQVDSPRERLVGFDAGKIGWGSFSVNMLSSWACLLVRLLTNSVALHLSRNLTPARTLIRSYPGNCLYVPVNS
jgi:protein-S-isoprenylcysteine O-methyltransferase Ste14